MNTMGEIINIIIENLGEIILSVICALIVTAIKRIAEKRVKDEEKKEIIGDCVKCVEQVYKNLHGEDKLNKAMESAEVILAQKGISISALELTTLIESALAELNKAFDNTSEKKIC